MHPLAFTALWSMGLAAAWEAGWWLRRRSRRGSVYLQAQLRAQELGRPLVVIGAPDGGVTAGYGCGDVTVDLVPSACSVSMQADVTKTLPFGDGSVVCYISCVLEYVDDIDAAVREIWRISGGEAFFVGVEPWTGAAFLYPGARRRLPPALR